CPTRCDGDIDCRCGTVVVAGGVTVGGAGAEQLFARIAVDGDVEVAMAGVVERRSFNGASPQETLALDGRFGAEQVEHGRIGRVGGGDADLGFARTFGASDELVFGDEV